MKFEKWHALGNAYVVVERDGNDPLGSERARDLCDVARGIGADGVIDVLSKSSSSATVEIWNPDGSVAEMSGNGIRIAARWLAEWSGRSEVMIETAGRSVHARMIGESDAELDVGTVTLEAPEPLSIAGEIVEVDIVSVGNPHAVIRRDGVTRSELLRLGPLIETHERFPARTNVQLVEPVGPTELRVLVWERGAGETPASGSSATAAAAVAVARGWCVSPVTVHMPGGDLFVTLAGSRATLLGPAERICVGETDL